MVCFKAFVILLIGLNYFSLLSSVNRNLVSADGLGAQLLWTHDTELSDKTKPKNVLFQDETVSEELKKEFNDIIGNIEIDFVAPSTHLMNMMNKLSTNTLVMFFKDYDYYFKTLNIGSTDKPILLSYLGLEYASDEQIDLWYKPIKNRSHRNVIESCKSLINKRNNALSKEVSTKIEKYKSQFHNKLFIGYLTFQKNSKLFMLDQYIKLCSKLDHEELLEELKDIVLTI